MLTPTVTYQPTAAEAMATADAFARAEARRVNRQTWHTVTPKRYMGMDTDEWDVVATVRAHHDYPDADLLDSMLTGD